LYVVKKVRRVDVSYMHLARPSSIKKSDAIARLCVPSTPKTPALRVVVDCHCKPFDHPSLTDTNTHEATNML
jgi:hypothetical protein